MIITEERYFLAAVLQPRYSGMKKNEYGAQTILTIHNLKPLDNKERKKANNERFIQDDFLFTVRIGLLNEEKICIWLC